jgi:RimJ/RimL family protein N-acetyltransferase
MPAPAFEALEIRPAEADEATLDAFARFVIEHAAESGREGSPHFSPSPRKSSRLEVRDSTRARWLRDLDEPLWGRAWLLWAGSTVVGELELRGGRLQAELHRATLGMGLRRSFTGKGHGGQLMERALAWARDEARLSWIDLGVFSDNLPAQKLYQRWGFQALGVRPDAFRIEGGVVVDDILMVLDLRAK